MEVFQLTSILLLVFFITEINSKKFGYKRKDQYTWFKHSPHCDGKWQSPIHIRTSRAIPLPIPAIEMVGYHNLLPGPITFKNTGHSVSLQPAEAHVKLPSVFGALLQAEFVLDSFHFHWGHKNSRGSEHVINGVRFPAEMHIVNRNINYSSTAEALNFPDGLTVLGFFFQVREKDNEALKPILKGLSNVLQPHSTYSLNETFTLGSLITEDTDVFYTYRGSLTTPPCSEAVTWIVFPDPLPVSFRQVKKFRQLYSSGDKRLVDNYRYIQHTNSRKVYVRNMWYHNKMGQNNTKPQDVVWSERGKHVPIPADNTIEI